MAERDERFPTITDQGLDALRRRIDVRIEHEPEPWCFEATRDNIRHYAHGIGDDNPLWCNPEYAAAGPYGGLVAPPSFLFACSRIISGYVGGLPGIHAMWAGADWTWHKPIPRNTELRTESWLKELIVRETRFAGRAVQQIYHVDFYDESGDLLAGADSWCFRTERDAARESGTKYDELKAKDERRYSEDELREFYEHYAKEEVRGSTPRYFEDVQVGDPIGTLVKGPMTVTGFIAYAQGWGGLYIRANKLAWQQFHRHPGLGITNRFNIPDCPERVHWEEDFAHEVGAPGAYDYGPERCSWMTHHVTNWMGDSGALERSYSRIRRHNPVGDMLFLTGEVVATRSEGDKALVEIEHHGVNQDGELSIEGTATVNLPRRQAA
jgi:acyl dehydratase